ncbi:hypothetical protein A8F94_00720 [Bacillus sp. FJAT-27225]|uniref:hypothetical protein n=1 Tax=Bacillus sp. FJAT-27225 TaxID=1743144 RepID=UPI00080C334B|nr:hypothetical protein [Bacillus sp. FJAT-27225]OCA90447.1 hypothetical protein A8F94_00720 [Bacillus sp. FJAT-27225]
MKKVKVLLAIFLVATISFYVKPAYVSACSCAVPESVETELKNKTAIFSGKVIRFEDPRANSFIQSSADPISVVFEVKSSWKGVKESQVIVNTAKSSASCGYEFSVGNDYLVYAYGDKNQLETGMCERTDLLQQASGDLQILGVGKPPTIKVDLASSESPPFMMIGSGVGIGLFLAAIIFIRWYRSKQN